MKVKDLKPADYNPRKISEAQLARLGHAMAKFGDLGGIVLNVRTGNLVGGHQRVKHLDPKWPIVKDPQKDTTGTVAVGHIETPSGNWSYREVDWPISKEKSANIAANAHGGEFSASKLRAIVEELSAAGELDLEAIGFDAAGLRRLIDWEPNQVPEGDPDEVPRVRPKAKTKKGDMCLLGHHRLLCGDSSRAEDVNFLMAGEAAEIMWTDPPYGVEYVGKTKNALKISNDGSAGLPMLLSQSFKAADSVLREGAAIYIAHPAGALSVVFGQAFLAVGWRLHQTLSWVKDSMVLGHSDYHYRHEPILYGYKAAAGRRGRGGKGWYGSNSETSVLEFPRPKRSEEHPTMKPVSLVEYCLRNSSAGGGIAYEPFGGSGTTIIACERLGRRCRAMELDPVYCDVIIERWEKFTGNKAVLKK